MNPCYQVYDCVCGFYNDVCQSIEKPLRAYVPEIPKNSVKLIIPSFVYSFTVSTILSGGNVIVGLAGGTLSLVAHLIHSLITVLVEKLGNFIKRNFDTPGKARKFQGHHYTYLLGLGAALYIGRGLGLAVNWKATFLATVPLLIWEFAAARLKIKSPIIGIAVG